MLTKDLIKQLQKLVDDNESAVPLLGEHTIMIDVFEKINLDTGFQYKGFSDKIIIDKSADGVYDIIRTFA
jgi:hypothetical protein